ncbi:hypothetical protein [uncultured Tateyamaria sp.]|uniref:tetratricopeptide repeat protein n=1 Tax=uncultured Tateyamaria sp. TaxID=455651 RepID=UPI00260BE0D3|nr:hypothetical protein [uncultured Tateyamaria sp.]
MVETSDDSTDLYAWLERARSETLLKGGQRRYDLLDYLVREEVEGRGENLKAYAIALDVLGRKVDFDPTTDSIVRVEVARLRDALELHYARSMDPSEPKITIPKGSYRPTIEWRNDHVELKTVRTSSRVFWPVISAAVVVGSVIFGWSLFQRSASDQSNEGIPILLAYPKVEHLPNATAEILTNFSSDLRRSLSKRATLTVLTNDGGESSSHYEYELYLRAIGLPEPDRISVELIDAETSAIDWADAYQLEAKLTAEGLGDLVSRVSDDLFPQIVSRSKDALDARPLEELNPWELYLLSTWIPGSALSTLDWEVQRRDIARRAVALDPQLGQAHSVLADKLAYLSSVDENYHSTEAVEYAHFHATQALQLAPRDANTLFNLSIHHWHLGENLSAIQMLERVIAIDPKNGFAVFLSMVFPYTCTPAPDEIVEAARAFDSQLKSDNPIRWVTLTWLGMLYLNREEFEAALQAEKTAHSIFHTPDTVMRQAVILHAAGRSQEAAKLIEDEKNNWPNLNPEHFAKLTMPRRCKYASDPSRLLSRYTDFASAN